MSERAAIIILAASIVVAGFLQWGFLDTTIYLHQILYGIVNGGINPTQAFKVVLILASSLILGRLFCGYICPLGAAQELVSKLVKKQVQYRRWAFRGYKGGILRDLHRTRYRDRLDNPFQPVQAGLALAWHLQAPGTHHCCRSLCICVSTLVYSIVPLWLPPEPDI